MRADDDSGAAVADAEFQRSLVEAIHEASPDGILVVDGEDMIVSHNQRLLEVWGIAPEEVPGADDGSLAGLPDHRLLSRALERVADRAGFLQRVQELYADPAREDLTEVALEDGRTLERHSRSLWSPGGRYLGRVWFFRDITERKQYERSLEALSHRDPLTGVANRRHFFQRADEEIARARRFGHDLACIMFDVDCFKRINDRWGHAAGDQVLQDLCAAVEEVLRREDLLARLGGEEFAVLVPETGLEGAATLAERIRRHLAERALPAGEEGVRYSVSAGVAALVPGEDTAEPVLRRADRALYAAKNAGRDRVSTSGEAP
ncbi:MAG TPA: diguanylate cyclase [Gammaproteobacteria bacterium]|nr:diguanylate cyclase [Gammaproteobacteria bacterium]